MADITINSFVESKQYGRVLYQKGRDLVEAELNEMQDIERVLRRRSMQNIFGHGFISTGFRITASANPNEILIAQGNSLIQGEHINNPSQFPIQALTTPVADRADIVYLKVREIEITSGDDPQIEFSDIGETARRLKLEWEVIVEEGTTTLPTTTGDLHDGGIHYELIGYLFRLAGNASVTTPMIVDARRIIGFTFLNEDKNLELVGGGDITYVAGTGAVSFTEPMRIIQPSTNGHAIIPITESPFVMANTGDTAYVVLDRAAAADYNVTVQIGNWYSIANNPNTFPIFYRSDDLKLYAVEGTVWAGTMTHPLRQNPFTGLIVDADVAAGADIQGTKLLDFSVPLTKLVSLPEGVPANGIILWDDSGVCPSGFTKLELGLNDTYIRVAGTGGTPNITPAGSNSHDHGSHNHSSGSYVTPIVVADYSIFFSGGPIFSAWDAFPTFTVSGVATVNFPVSGTSGDTSISSASHEPKHVQLVLCKKT